MVSVVMPLRSRPRRIRPAATIAKPWTKARPADNPHPPRHRRYRQTTRRRSGHPVPQRDDSDRARLPARARRPCGLRRDFRYSASGPVNCAGWSGRENRLSSLRPDLPANFSRRSKPNSRTFKKSATSSVMDKPPGVRKVNHKSDTRSAACATRLTTCANSSPGRHRA